jgi:hypothetical protein
VAIMRAHESRIQSHEVLVNGFRREWLALVVRGCRNRMHVLYTYAIILKGLRIRINRRNLNSHKREV